MMNPERKRPITVEDLLRLKRAERPAPEFWERFDRELRAKQLSALVEKKSWWSGLPALFAGFRRYQLPLGATAVLAITFVATRDYSISVSKSPQPVLSAPADGAEIASGSAVSTSVESTMRETPRYVSASLSSPVELGSAADAATVTEAVAVADSQGSGLIRMLRTADSTAESPSARPIAGNFASAQAGEPMSARSLFATSGGFESRAMPSRLPTVEPLSQMTTPEEMRRSRFTTAMVSSFGSDGRDRTTSANVARRIRDDSVYESSSRRIGATGNSLGVRF